MIDHNEECARLVAVQAIADDNTADELYAMWNDLPVDVTAYILAYLQANDEEKYAALIACFGGGSDETELNDGTTIAVENIPTDATLVADVATDEQAEIGEGMASTGAGFDAELANEDEIFVKTNKT